MLVLLILSMFVCFLAGAAVGFLYSNRRSCKELDEKLLPLIKNQPEAFAEVITDETKQAQKSNLA